MSGAACLYQLMNGSVAFGMSSLSSTFSRRIALVQRLDMQPQAGPSTPLYLPLPPRHLAAPPPAYHRPVLISTYSHQPDRSIVHDDSSMAYYRPAPMGSDLNYAFDRRVERDESVEEHLDGLCEGLRRVIELGGNAERKGGVITWRGMITR